MKKWILAAIILAVVGLLDSAYLIWEHYQEVTPPCTTGFSFVDCGTVLRSKYAEISGVPLAGLGMLHYGILVIVLLTATKYRAARYLAVLMSVSGLLASLYFVYLQLFVIMAICLYCMVSAVDSLFLFGLMWRHLALERKEMVVAVGGWVYRQILKPIFFTIDPEVVHVNMVGMGEVMSKLPGYKTVTNYFLGGKSDMLSQKLMGIEFGLPIGLAAGFDYEARLTKALAPLGFGFQSVGTITLDPWAGNDRPRLGRLPQSKSLMVNKGFKNPGSEVVISRIGGKTFDTPVGISIGDALGSVENIVSAFTKFESSDVRNAYYELNISCPNLLKARELDLKKLFVAVDKIGVKKPVFVKMPINKSDKEILTLLEMVSKHKTFKAVIFGNLQKDRTDKSFVRDEAEKFSVGNFSGKPTYERSNQLITLAYKKYGKRFVIVGCGGVFCAADAYEKIKRGASIIQMITGMIFEGPQVITEINFGLEKLLKKDGHTHISQAVGRNK